MENVTAKQYAIDFQENGDWIQLVASPERAESQRHWRHLRAMGVRAPIRMVGFDVPRDSEAEATTA